MQVQPHAYDKSYPVAYWMSDEDHHFGGDQSPLNDSDADEETSSLEELDLGDLGLDEFADSDKLDIGSSTLG
jgi:hypothetical protein